MLAEDQLDLTPLQKQVLVQGFQEIKKQEMEAQQQMMGGGGGGGGPTSGSVRNGAASDSNKQVEEQSFVNPGATDPLENVDEEA